jgi:hypothetical protein
MPRHAGSCSSCQTLGRTTHMDALVALLNSDANAANAFGALASAAAAFLALLVSAISVGISVWAAQSQRRHNELSVRPLAEITVADYETSLRVKLRNHGTGPMIVTAITVSNGSSTRPTILAWMPQLANGRHWTDFTDEVHDRTLAPGGELVLLEITEDDGEIDFAQYRDPTRAALAPLTVNVEYTNIYNSVMPPRQKALSWFGRHGAA